MIEGGKRGKGQRGGSRVRARRVGDEREGGANRERRMKETDVGDK